MTLYYRPETLPAALKLLGDPQQNAAPLYYAPRAKNLKDRHVDVLVDLSGLELDKIQILKKEVRIGSMVSLETLAENETVRGEWNGALHKAVLCSAAKSMRGLATLGGVLTEPENPPEILIVLMALGADLVITSENKKAEKMSVESFVCEQKQTLPKGCLIREIVIPLNYRMLCTLERIARTEKDTSIVAVAARGNMTQRKAYDLHVVAAGIQNFPCRLTAVENALTEDTAFTLTNIRKASELAANETVTRDDYRGSAEYRQAMVPVLVRRTLEELRKTAIA